MTTWDPEEPPPEAFEPEPEATSSYTQEGNYDLALPNSAFELGTTEEWTESGLVAIDESDFDSDIASCMITGLNVLGVKTNSSIARIIGVPPSRVGQVARFRFATSYLDGDPSSDVRAVVAFGGDPVIMLIPLGSPWATRELFTRIEAEGGTFTFSIEAPSGPGRSRAHVDTLVVSVGNFPEWTDEAPPVTPWS